MTTSEQDYLSVHIYYNTQDLRTVLLGCVDPLVQQLRDQDRIARHFFIRYWEGGSHVRLRLLPKTGVSHAEIREPVDLAIRQYLEDSPSFFDADPATLRPLMRSLFEYEYGHEELIRIYGENGDIPIAENNSVAYLPYRPEYGRYGGVRGVELSEQHFHISSEIALEALRDGNSHVRTSTLGLALQLMLHFAFAFFNHRDKVAGFFEQYAARWQALSIPENMMDNFSRLYDHQAKSILAHFSKVDRLHQRLEATETGVLSKWLHHAYQLRDGIVALHEAGELELHPPAASVDEAIRRLLNSYVHMMNNRLGMLILEEVYLSHLIVRALREGA
jgi:thiopeptide-type bacteriocin biosynthesis protein